MSQEHEPTNEIVAAARDAKARLERLSERTAARAREWPIAAIGLGVGIGSAAVAAAVLYANRERAKDREGAPLAPEK